MRRDNIFPRLARTVTSSAERVARLTFALPVTKGTHSVDPMIPRESWVVAHCEPATSTDRWSQGREVLQGNQANQTIFHEQGTQELVVSVLFHDFRLQLG